MRRIDVAGHDRKEFYILLAKRTREAGAIAHLDFVKGLVLYILHAGPITASLARPSAARARKSF
jgi:hypothetical protein